MRIYFAGNSIQSILETVKRALVFGDDDYIIDRYEPHEHSFEPMRMICVHCGITAEAFRAGRDRPPTWEDVDEAYRDGRRVGIEIGQLLFKHTRRQKLIEVGYWLALRRMSNSIGGK